MAPVMTRTVFDFREYEGAVLLSKRSSLAAKVLVLEDNMSASTASMNLLYGTGMSQPPTGAGPSQLAVTDFRARQPQQQFGAPGIVGTGSTGYGNKPSLRFRSSGKRTRAAAGRNQQQQQEGPPSVQQSAPVPRQQSQQLAVSPTAQLSPYLLYGRRSNVPTGTGFLPYYLQSDGSPQQHQQVYAQPTRQQPIHQTTSQQQQATELQLHYHLHQHYGSPTPYYPNASDTGMPKPSLSPITTVQQQDQVQQGFGMEPVPPSHVVDHGSPFWLYSSNQVVVEWHDGEGSVGVQRVLFSRVKRRLCSHRSIAQSPHFRFKK